VNIQRSDHGQRDHTPVPAQPEPELAGQTAVVIGGRLRQPARELRAQRTAAFDATDFGQLATFLQGLPAPIDHVLVTAGGPTYGPLLEMGSAQVRDALSDHVTLDLEVAATPPARCGQAAHWC
jgi:hypothetical protein